MQMEGRTELRQALLSAFSELEGLTLEDGRRLLVTDGEHFRDRSAPAIAHIHRFCEANFTNQNFDWLSFMNSTSNNPVVGFGEEELSTYADPNAAARAFVIENVFNVLFPGGFNYEPQHGS